MKNIRAVKGFFELGAKSWEVARADLVVVTQRHGGSCTPRSFERPKRHPNRVETATNPAARPLTKKECDLLESISDDVVTNEVLGAFLELVFAGASVDLKSVMATARTMRKGEDPDVSEEDESEGDDSDDDLPPAAEVAVIGAQVKQGEVRSRNEPATAHTVHPQMISNV